jgi:glycerophosphoryl diester phosphodiesterase
MGQINPQGVSLTGAQPTYQAVTVGGDIFRATAGTFLHVKNAGAGTVTGTVRSMSPPAPVPHITPNDVTFTVPAGSERMVGPFRKDLHGSKGTDLAYLVFDTITSVTVAAMMVDDPTPAAATPPTGAGAIRAVDLPDGWIASHRGWGYYSEDDSLRAARIGADFHKSVAGAVDAGDWRLTSDSVPVSMHDVTTGRTCTTNVTVATTTSNAFSSLKLLARTPVEPTNDAPPSVAQVMDVIRRQGVICAPEMKLTGSATLNTAAVAAIQARGMQQQTIVGSALLADLAPFKAAGIPTMYIIDNAPDTQANIIAAAPNFVCFNHNRSPAVPADAVLQALSAAGIKIGTWTLDSQAMLAATQARLAGLGIPLNHYYTNDTRWMTGRDLLPVQTTDPFATGRFFPGMVPGQPYNSFGLDTATSRGAFIGSPYRFALPDPDQGSFVLQSWMAPVTSSTGSITVTITYDAVGTNTARWAAVIFNCPDDHPQWNDGTTANLRGLGYSALLAPNGNLQLWRQNSDGGAQTQMGSTVATSAITSGQTATLKIEPLLPSSQIRVTRTDSGGFTPILVTDATWRGNFVWFGKKVLTGEGLSVSFSNVTVVP